MNAVHDPEELKLAVRRALIAVSEGYPDYLTGVYAPDFHGHLIRTTPIAELDLKQSRELSLVNAGAFPGMVPEFLMQIAQDSRVASRYVLQGSFEGVYFGVQPTRRPVRIHMNSIHHFNDEGKITEAWIYWDNLAWMQQLGAVPSPTGSVTLPPVTPPDPLWPGSSSGREAFNSAKVRLAYTAADAGAVDTFDQFYDPHFHGFESGGSSIEGVDAMRDRVRAFTSAVPNRRINVLETVAEGSLVATHISMTGEFTKPLVQANGMTVQPTGNTMNIAGVEFYSFDPHGMILGSWPEFDVMDFLQQIGVI